MPGGSNVRARVRRGSPRDGFSLIEILIALIVLVVGLVGIVVLFPVGLQNTQAAVGDTMAANVAESVHAALVSAHRTVKPSASVPPGRPTATLIHDLFPCNDGAGRYKFEMPLLTDAPTTIYCLHPASGAGVQIKLPPPASTTVDVFSLGADPWIGAAVGDVHAVSDPTEPYRQYAFNFTVRKVPTIPAGGNSLLYDYNITVYRLLGVGPTSSGSTVSTGGGGGGGGGTVATGGSTPARVVATLSARISGP